ncbi:MAG TPA: hypothetical protein VEQ87_13335 [Burkholderiales bacterium]|nr:hypothetical protein [Burkholderiales bacterium]
MTPMVKKVLAGIAALGALASVVAGREQPSFAPAPEPKVDTRLQASTDIDLAKLEARIDEGAKIDAFAPKNFSPAVAPQAGPAAKREAPALPFRYIGKMVDNGRLAVFLANGADSFTVTEGERVGDYRVDKITEAEIRFTYLPMKAKQTLPL